MAHPDIDALPDEGLQATIQFLEKNGEFFPFGITMVPDGNGTQLNGR